MDIRVEKTKRKLKNNLIQLLEEYHILDITVVQLCSKAHVNRSTFYVHYDNISDCFDEIADEIIAEMRKSIKQYSSITTETYLQVYFNTARKHKVIFQTIHSTNVYNPMIKKLIELNNEFMNLDLFVPTDSKNLTFSFIFYGFYGMVGTWIRNGCKESNHELIHALYQMFEKKI